MRCSACGNETVFDFYQCPKCGAQDAGVGGPVPSAAPPAPPPPTSAFQHDPSRYQNLRAVAGVLNLFGMLIKIFAALVGLMGLVTAVRLSGTGFGQSDTGATFAALTGLGSGMLVFAAGVVTQAFAEWSLALADIADNSFRR